MAQITNVITIHEYNKMTAEQRAALGSENLLAVVQQDWEEVRIQASIAIVQGWASTPQGLTKNCMVGAVELADALIAELQKKGGEQ